MKERRPAVGNGRSGAAFDWAGLAPAARAKAIAGLRAAGLGDAAIARQFGIGREEIAAAMRPAGPRAAGSETTSIRAAAINGGTAESREGDGVGSASPEAPAPAAPRSGAPRSETAASIDSEPDATPAGAVVAIRSGATAGETAPLATRPWGEMPPEARAAAVRRLRGEGRSASVIAARLGTTRNAVIGVMHRNGMSVPGTTTHVMRRPKQDGSAAGGRTRSAQVHAGPVSLAPVGQSAVGSRQSEEGVERVRRAPPKTAMPDVVVVADPPPPGGIPFAALDASFLRCRRPLWDEAVPLDEKRWCGAAVEPGRSYCPDCAGRLVQRVPGWLKRITGEAAPVAPTPASLARTEAQRRGRAAARRASFDCPLPTADCRSSAPRRQR